MNSANRPFGRSVGRILVAIAMVIGISLVSTTSAQAAEWKCDGPRCYFSLNKEETKKLAEGGVPMNTPSGQWGLVWQFMYLGHKPILLQYAKRGWCTQFNMSALPWENQGLIGYRC